MAELSIYVAAGDDTGTLRGFMARCWIQMVSCRASTTPPSIRGTSTAVDVGCPHRGADELLRLVEMVRDPIRERSGVDARTNHVLDSCTTSQ